MPNGDVIQYTLERRSRRTIGLKVSEKGLTIHAPKLLLIRELEKLLSSKARWIQQKLAKLEENKIPAIVWQDKENLLYLGQDIQLDISKHSRNTVPKLVNNRLQLQLKDTNPDFVARKVMQWYQKQAQPDFIKRIAFFAKQLGVPTPPSALSNARTRWGSCNSRGQIRLSWRLVQAPPEMINYVVCHELAHLKEMNHSPRFYAVLDKLYPQHRKHEKALDLLSPQLHRL